MSSVRGDGNLVPGPAGLDFGPFPYWAVWAPCDRLQAPCGHREDLQERPERSERLTGSWEVVFDHIHPSRRPTGPSDNSQTVLSSTGKSVRQALHQSGDLLYVDQVKMSESHVEGVCRWQIFNISMSIGAP